MLDHRPRVQRLHVRGPGRSRRPAPIWAPAWSARIGALSGPLHGGAPSRALDALDAIGTPDRARRDRAPEMRGAGERIMGFGHAVYTTDDPRSVMLRGEVAQRPRRGPLVDLAVQVEQTVVTVLAELKPGRQLHTPTSSTTPAW